MEVEGSKREGIGGNGGSRRRGGATVRTRVPRGLYPGVDKDETGVPDVHEKTECRYMVQIVEIRDSRFENV